MLGLYYTIFDTGGEDAEYFTLTKIRRAGGRTNGPAKRTSQQDLDFETAMLAYLKEKAP